ncbi:IclR family transcriptional regulator [Roseomonas sp. E05]|uniref:IclR family transcriptional regulator n=1 Tax=Roseomonas sp. E05 TaxID=3046310 RepID=UPI0024BA54F6|nr:IclR family transcriptional regulator [Roseomonas sp. E05]MDJ0388935.1 IclR family transcriptional regulator [Roseomonas sp. E05]
MPKQTAIPADAETAAKPAQDYTVAAVEQALKLLAQVGETPGRGLSELARAAGCTKPRAYRLLQTMEASGFLMRRAQEPRYWLGFRALQLAGRAGGQVDLVGAATPVLARIGAACDETVQVRVREGTESVCVAAWETPRIVRFHAAPGNRAPIHVGSSKLLLAYAPARLQQSVLGGELVARTPQTLTDPGKLAAELTRIRAQGSCVSKGENDPEAVAAGAPIHDPSGEVIAVLVVAAPLARVPRAKLQQMQALAIEGAAEISRALAAPG